mmetsp:Transcript_8938/g.19085  ORF Transcript_8938/g.19085 Transcript_8938/m.19085 type:complete len:704 (-) Transcript_8938:2515-4626(-)
MGSGTSKPKLFSKFNSKNGESSSSNTTALAPSVESSNSKTSQKQSSSSASTKPQSSTTYSSSGSQAATEPEYTGAVHPHNEAERMGHLCALNVLDTEAESRFDDITRLCCMIFKVPICLVSLVDKDRQWFKSVQGITAKQTDRKSSFCAWTLLPEFPEVLVVENALEDLRFRNNPLVVGAPFIRFYAGCPLIANNQQRLGSLCIIDNKPRQFDAENCTMLTNFGEMVIREIEKDAMLQMQRQKSEALTQENTQLLRAFDCFSEGVMLCNLSFPTWPVLFVNEAFEKTTTMSKDVATSKGFWDLFELPPGVSMDKTQDSYTKAISDRQGFNMTARAKVPGLPGPLRLEFRCANADNIDLQMPLVGIPSHLASTSPHDGPCYYFVKVLLPGLDSGAVLGSNNNILSSSASINTALSIVDKKMDPFEDVRLGPMLGKGAYGRVYRGQWNGAQVAIKVMEHTEQPEGNLEALLSGGVSHPNVVQTYRYCTRPMSDARDTEDRKLVETWMIMEFCNKGSLSDAVDRGLFRMRHSLFDANFKCIISTAKEIASALCYLHGRGILHADLTGNNILLSASEKDERKFIAKVADFGLSRVIGNAMVMNTRTYGTVSHTPPELLVDGTLSKATDVYAFGVLMWEMYMGQRPYMGLSHGQIIHHITCGRSLQLSTGCPNALRKFITRCYSVKPEERPTFPQILQELEELEQELV